MTHKDRIRLALLLLVVLLPIEIAGCAASYETLGEADSFMLICVCLLLNTFGFILCLARFWPSAVSMITFGLLFTGYQTFLVARMHIVATEAANIVGWAYSQKLKTGSYPEDLADYNFLDPDCVKFVDYVKFIDQNDEQFSVTYYVGTRSTRHWYNQQNGWSYYPD